MGRCSHVKIATASQAHTKMPPTSFPLLDDISHPLIIGARQGGSESFGSYYLPAALNCVLHQSEELGINATDDGSSDPW